MRAPIKRQNALLLLAIALISVLPLWLYVPTAGEEAFAGADGKAQAAIARIAPGYRPWVKPLLVPPSNEIASLLFALQAAIGAGVIGYWLGAAVTRERLQRAAAVDRQPAPNPPTDGEPC